MSSDHISLLIVLGISQFIVFLILFLISRSVGFRIFLIFIFSSVMLIGFIRDWGISSCSTCGMVIFFLPMWAFVFVLVPGMVLSIIDRSIYNKRHTTSKNTSGNSIVNLSTLYTSTEGRIGRQAFWTGCIILVVIGIVLLILNLFWFRYMSVYETSFLWIVAAAYPAYTVFAKRFQDRNKSGLLGAIPVGLYVFYQLLKLFGLTGNRIAHNIYPNTLDTLLLLVGLPVMIWCVIELGILRGTVGDNQYGPDPVDPSPLDPRTGSG